MEPPSRQALGLSPGDVIAGKFRLEGVIGRGGMGAVWAARHLQLDVPVALKFIEAEQGTELDRDEARVRFEREARAAAQIRSPHVVQILDHGIDPERPDRPYIAMELLEGEDLGERLAREGRIPVAAAARLLTQSAKALRRAHEAGIIHRDLKPGNVFLARFDDDEVVKILDFGVAKMRRSGAIEEALATQTGIVFGSPAYMSPEQARGARAIDHRSDLWSLAVIVFRAVTGVKPFQGASIADLVIKLCIDPLPVATRLAPDLPPAIDRFFERAFARDPDQRFASAQEMAAAFEAVAGAVAAPAQAAPIVAPAPSAPGGSGPHVAFAPGTLTPPPADLGRPAGRADPTLVSSTTSLPPIPGPAGLVDAHSRDSSPTAAIPMRAPELRPSRGLLFLAASLGGGALGMLVLVLVLAARHGSSGSAVAAASAAAPASILLAPPPDPAPSSSAPEPLGSTAAPEPPAALSAPAASAPHAPIRTGKKRSPNFGY
jgi:serine/threonine protein kinase